MKNGRTKKPLALIGAKVPVEIREAIEKQANAEERSVSQVVSRLLVSHPLLVKAIKTKKADNGQKKELAAV